jgi:hypothetical protein
MFADQIEPFVPLGKLHFGNEWSGETETDRQDRHTDGAIIYMPSLKKEKCYINFISKA